MIHKMAEVSGNVIGKWITDNVVFVFIIIIALSIFVAAMTKKVRDAFITFGLSCLGFLMLFIGSNWSGFQDWLGRTFLGG